VSDLGVLAMAVGGLAGAGYVLWRAVCNWRGVGRPVQEFSARLFEVFPRSYLTFAMLVSAFGAFLGIACIGGLLGLGDALFPVGFVLLLAMLPLLLLHLWVNAFNRPRFLVPPRFRGLPGWVAEARARRRVARIPKRTKHKVEIRRITPPRSADQSPYLVAQCTSGGCDWHAYADDGVAHELADLRAKVSVHTSLVPRRSF
jgi:hypothetical protein